MKTTQQRCNFEKWESSKTGRCTAWGACRLGAQVHLKQKIKIKRRKKKKKNRCISTSNAPPIKLELSAGQYTAVMVILGIVLMSVIVILGKKIVDWEALVISGWKAPGCEEWREFALRGTAGEVLVSCR